MRGRPLRDANVEECFCLIGAAVQGGSGESREWGRSQATIVAECHAFAKLKGRRAVLPGGER